MSNAYTYGFNGQEKSDEIKGEGNSYTAEFWEYDPRIGRRWNLDPVSKENLSPYLVLNNNPIVNTDPDGDDWFKDKKGNIAWNDSKKKSISIDKLKYRNIGDAITIRTNSYINNPNDLPLPNDELRQAASGDKLTTYLTIRGIYNKDGSFDGFKMNYKRIVGATFDLKGMLDGVDYPGRPNTSDGAEFFSKGHSLNAYIVAHVTTPPIETAGLLMMGRNVDVYQDVVASLKNNSKLNIEIAHGSYPSVNMTAFGSREIFSPPSYTTFYNYQQNSYVHTHVSFLFAKNFKDLLKRANEMSQLHINLNNRFEKVNKAKRVAGVYPYMD